MRDLAIVMTVYNESLDFVSEAVESVLKNLEGINGSQLFIGVDRPNDELSDCIFSCLESYSKCDLITVVYFDKNEGLAKTLNKLISTHCKGYKFIARMDADDVVINNRFRVQLDYLNKNEEVDLLGAAAIKINETGDKIGLFDAPVIVNQRWGSQLIHPTWMFKYELFEELDGYRDYAAAQDYDFSSRAIASGKQVTNIPKHLLMYRIRHNSIGLSRRYIQISYKYQISRSLRKGDILSRPIIIENRPVERRIFEAVESLKSKNLLLARLFSLLSLAHMRNYILIVAKKLSN